MRPGVEGNREFETIVYIRNLTGGENKSQPMTEPKILRLSDLIRYPDNKDCITGVTLETNLLLIQYMKGVNQFVFDSSRGMVLPPDVEKASVLYDALKGVVVKHTMRILTPASDLSGLLTSPSASVVVDQNLQVRLSIILCALK